MATRREGFFLREIIVGVLVTVLSALILLLLGIGQGGDPVVSPPLSTPPPPQHEQPMMATVCMTGYGSCPLFYTMAPGMPCTCYDAFGYPRVSGITR
jgi:hypothetical protein